MTDFRKGDEYALPVTLAEECAGPGVWRAEHTNYNGDKASIHVHAPSLELIRRAPVDLATCPLPVKVLWGRSYSADATGELHHRGVLRGFVLLDNGDEAAPLLSSLRPLDSSPPAVEQTDQSAETYQSRVGLWIQACFGAEIATDKLERCDRLTEETLELVQAVGYSAERAHALVDYVFNRPVGEAGQEVGGVMNTLAALCNACEIDLNAEAEKELARVWTKVEAIRAKQKTKPIGSALPIPSPCPPCHFMLNGIAVPNPMTEAPKVGTSVNVAYPVASQLTGQRSWLGDAIDRHQLRAGLLHPTKDAARTHAEAIIAAGNGEIG